MKWGFLYGIVSFGKAVDNKCQINVDRTDST